MQNRSVIRVLLFVLCTSSLFSQTSTQSATPTLSEEQIRDIVRQAADKDIQNQKAARDYTYLEHEEEHKLGGDGKVKSTETRTYEVMVLSGEQMRKQVAKNDQPLSPKDAAKEEQKIQKVIDKRAKESEDDRKKRIEREEKQLEEGRKFVKEIADAYNFRMVGTELLDERQTYVIDAEPRPGYEPHMKDAKFLPKFHFRVWIDEKEKQWVKVDAAAIETVSIGLFLARLHKGSSVQIELLRINDEVWLPKHVALKVDARIALLKGFNMAMDVTYRDYKKFRTDSKIVGVGEIPSEHEP